MTQQDKTSLNRIHEKYYGKDAKVKKENAKITKAVKGKADLKEIQRRINVPNAGLDYMVKTGEMIDQAKADMGLATRADLMKQAKEQHIAYFRIMTKAELTEIIKDKAPLMRICEIQEGAKARWKAGWKK